FDQNCNNSTTGSESSTGQASIVVTGATPGQVFVVCVKYSLKALVGVPMGPNDGCCYNFITEVNGHIVDADPQGLVVGTVQSCGVDIASIGGGSTTGGGSSTGGGGVETGSGDDPGVIVPHRALSGAAEAQQVSDSYLDAYRPVPNPFRDGMRMAYVVSV